MHTLALEVVGKNMSGCTYIPLANGCGGIAQWQSIRLQIERSPVQIRVGL